MTSIQYTSEYQDQLTLINELSINDNQKNDPLREYQLQKFLGQGGFAKCYKIQNTKNKQIYAAKIISKISLTSLRHKKCLIKEIKIHKKLKHPNITQFEHFFQDQNNIYILLEYCKNGTLGDLKSQRKKISETEIKYYVVQIVKGLQYLRSQDIIHRDLKLANILIDHKMKLKIADFGLATKIRNNKEKKKICGTPNYLAPETIDKEKSYSYEIDIWALGIIVYYLLVGYSPFHKNSTK